MCSKNKGAIQLHGYREAGLRLCFGTCILLVFSCGGYIVVFLMCRLNFHRLLVKRNYKGCECTMIVCALSENG